MHLRLAVQLEWLCRVLSSVMLLSTASAVNVCTVQLSKRKFVQECNFLLETGQNTEAACIVLCMQSSEDGSFDSQLWASASAVFWLSEQLFSCAGILSACLHAVYPLPAVTRS